MLTLTNEQRDQIATEGDFQDSQNRPNNHPHGQRHLHTLQNTAVLTSTKVLRGIRGHRHTKWHHHHDDDLVDLRSRCIGSNGIRSQCIHSSSQRDWPDGNNWLLEAHWHTGQHVLTQFTLWQLKIRPSQVQRVSITTNVPVRSGNRHKLRHHRRKGRSFNAPTKL